MQLLVMITVFLGGLREEIWTKVLESGPTEITASVKQSEEGHEGQCNKDEEIIAIINAVKARRGRRPFCGQRGCGSQQGGRGGYGNSYSGNIVVKCRFCQITGHFQKDCRKCIAANAPLVDANGKPLKITSIQEEEKEDQEQTPNYWNSLN